MASHNSSLFVLFLLSLVSLTVSETTIKMFPRKHLVRPDSHPECESWKFAVEVNAAGSWYNVPHSCVGFVEDYFNSGRYLEDSIAVSKYALGFSDTVKLTGNGKDAWVFDIDETLLSNLPYYKLHGFGSESFNETAFNAWVDLGQAPALPASLSLYIELKNLGFSIFLLTGRPESQRIVTTKNLYEAGYYGWEKLILRGPSDEGVKATAYKSGKRSELVKQGYIIHGSSGDQWSDLFGSPIAKRSFKLPNPMYYIG